MNHRPVLRDWDGFALSPSRFEPGFFGDLDLRQGLSRGIAECRTTVQVRDIGNISAVLLAVKDVDVVIFHHYPVASPGNWDRIARRT